MERVCVIGLGYIGLPAAAMLASRGYSVAGFDINLDIVAAINSAQPHFHEPELQMLLSAAVTTGQLIARTEPSEAEYYIIAVPTPFMEGKKPDLSYVEAACRAIAPYLRAGCTIILESTLPVGTTEKLTDQLAALRPDLVFPRYKDEAGFPDVLVSHCPERVLPGQMLRELVSNDRIIGGMTEASADRAVALYQSFVRSNLLVTDCRTAEFAKLIENAFRDVNIAFANELSLIADRLGIDVWQAIGLANRHPRVNILQPGPGVGGHCIPVDPWFIVDSAPDLSRLVRAAREVNDAKPGYVTERVRELARRLKEPVVACYGLTYKADVEDLRESPALEIVHELAQDNGIEMLVCEPNIAALPPLLSGKANIRLVDASTARCEADIVVFLVGHKEFRRLKPSLFLNKMVVDAISLLGATPGRQQTPVRNSDGRRRHPAPRAA